MTLTDTVVHEVDTIRWLLGQELTTVTVLTPRPTRLSPAGVHDPQVVVFETRAARLLMSKRSSGPSTAMTSAARSSAKPAP